MTIAVVAVMDLAWLFIFLNPDKNDEFAVILAALILTPFALALAALFWSTL